MLPNMIMKYAIKHKMRMDNPCTGAVILEKTLTVEEIENTSIDDEFLENNELTQFLEATYHHGMPLDIERIYLIINFDFSRATPETKSNLQEL
ncbi:hypothetical protein KQJ23_20920 [Paenibacillus sp. MSJ-6]|uniref:Uncharacterized protein n=2 Tax=Paenibacillus brevis TaxID=2841508 RepID=A0ABS6FVQ7_9BACL|nr:hypothetical protein [Paenibacillus brevis]